MFLPLPFPFSFLSCFWTLQPTSLSHPSAISLSSLSPTSNPLACAFAPSQYYLKKKKLQVMFWYEASWTVAVSTKLSFLTRNQNYQYFLSVLQTNTKLEPKYVQYKYSKKSLSYSVICCSSEMIWTSVQKWCSKLLGTPDQSRNSFITEKNKELALGSTAFNPLKCFALSPCPNIIILVSSYLIKAQIPEPSIITGFFSSFRIYGRCKIIKNNTREKEKNHPEPSIIFHCFEFLNLIWTIKIFYWHDITWEKNIFLVLIGVSHLAIPVWYIQCIIFLCFIPAFLV